MTMGDWRGERRADGTASGRPSPAEGRSTAPVSSPATGAETTVRTETSRGKQIMTDPHHQVAPGREPSPVRSCWMCGIRLPAGQMMPDGGSACLDVRWYCRDTWACTQRWTSHAARLASVRGGAETAKAQGEKAADSDGARPVPV